MRSFWGFYKNEEYCVGCNGGTVYIYDREEKELARFKDMAYAYKAKFLPGSNIIVVKSTEGSLAVYSLDELKLMKKIVITRNVGQDQGFAFSPDGKYLYNIERPRRSTETCLVKYNTAEFEVEERLFEDRTDMFLEHIEFDEESGNCYLLGFMRRESDRVYDYGFVAQLLNQTVTNVVKLEEECFRYVQVYKEWELSGFTKKALEWSSRLKDREIVPVTLKEVWENTMHG